MSSDEPPVVPANRIEELRRELPPRVTAGQGRKTHGRWVGADGATRSIISGRDHDSEFAEHELERRGMPGATTRPGDVELKLAAHMLRNGIRHVTVVINHSPCKGDYGCDTLVPILLPEGSTLTVHGVTRQGAKMYKRYTGGATPWWR
ncbi:MAG TPA: DddA-like double-stranded DNA deaminase toxin [Pseudonocardiaceae bacterium]|nr:DddA-like double-stranded DNA deaminase toxin [Pseudonocardiaceae bacterium]